VGYLGGIYPDSGLCVGILAIKLPILYLLVEFFEVCVKKSPGVRFNFCIYWSNFRFL
jgi:hypothetical protein